MQFPHTVTLFRKGCDPIVLEGVLLESTRGTSVAKTGMNSADAVTLHIPFSLVQDLSLNAETDYFARGRVLQNGKYQSIREQYETYRVTSCAVYDYGSPNMKHWEVGGR